MLFAGIDVGAQSVKVAVLSDNELVFSSTTVTDEEGGVAAREALDKARVALGLPLNSLTAVVSTGIGKDGVAFATGKRTEEICHSREHTGFFLQQGRCSMWEPVVTGL